MIGLVSLQPLDIPHIVRLLFCGPMRNPFDTSKWAGQTNKFHLFFNKVIFVVSINPLQHCFVLFLFRLCLRLYACLCLSMSNNGRFRFRWPKKIFQIASKIAGNIQNKGCSRMEGKREKRNGNCK